MSVYKKISPDTIQFLPWSKDKDYPTRRLLICKLYTKPEKYGSLYLPDTTLEDDTGTLWEVVRASIGAKRHLGTEDIEEGDIIKVRGHDFPVGLDTVDERDDRHLVAIDAEAVYQIWQVGERVNGNEEEE